MNKLISSRYWWLYLLILLLGINYLASLVHMRVDLTTEKRYTLSQPTRRLLKNLHERVTVTVFLQGDMPAGFKKLRNSAQELLQEFRELSGNRLQINFQRPGQGMDDSAREHFIVYLRDSLGLKPTNVKVQARADEAQEERLVFPGALVSYKGKEVAVNFLEGLNIEGSYGTLNSAEALLEYKLAHAIQKLAIEKLPNIGYLVGNGEPLNYNVYDLIERTLRPNYGFGFVPIDSVRTIPTDFNAIMIVKPTKPFTDQQKLKLDQYVMNGGRLIWFVDRLYAEMDSLMRKQSDFVAFDRELNIDDLLFKYGVRINPELVQDLQCDKMPLVVGNYGNQPQMQLTPWFYFPLLLGNSNHPITKNLDDVLSIFPNSIDTVKTTGLKKTFLLTTSPNARTLSTPAIVSLNSVKTEEDLKTFNRSNIPVGMLIEGRFSSLYTHRLSAGMEDTLAGIYHQPFRAASNDGNKMIVMADADIVTNVFTQREGPLPMGYNQFTNRQYGNRDFVLNCIEYLVNPSGILEARSKDFALRLLDPKKTDEQKGLWQIINIAVPIIIVLLFGLVYQLIRKRRYRG